MEDALKERISKQLTELRTAKGYSQEKLANLADVDRSYISRIERKMMMPTLLNLIKICNALDVKASDFVRELE